MSLKRRYHVFTILCVLVVSVGGILTWRGFAQGTIVPAGLDEFDTPNDLTTNENWNLPAGFFPHNPPAVSNAISVRVSFGGDASECAGDHDTTICRPLDVVVPGDTPGVLTKLKLVAVGFDGVAGSTLRVSWPGYRDELYTVTLQKSETIPSHGTVTFNSGGTGVLGDFPIAREVICKPTLDPSQPIRCAESETELDPATGQRVFGDFNLRGGLFNWFLVNNHCLIFANAHKDGRLDDHGRVVKEHNAVCPHPTPSPSASPSPSPTGSALPKPTATFHPFGG